MPEAHPLSGSTLIGAARNGGGLLRFALLAALLATATGLAIRPPADGETMAVGLLGLLAAVGASALLAAAGGFLRLTRPGEDDVLAAVANASPDGIAVAGRDGRVFYANAAWFDLSGMERGVRPASVERAFSREPDAAQAVYRLAAAARAGRPHEEEVRLETRPDRRPGCGRYRIRVAPLSWEGASAWTVTDITAESERQEEVLREFHRAIDDLDGIPAGFFSLDEDDRIVSMNATLAEWLGHDLAEATARPLRLTDIVASDGFAWMGSGETCDGEPGGQMLDADLIRRDGGVLPVRLLHKAAPEGTAAPSRVLVLDRSAADNAPDPARIAKAPFARAFDKAPFGVATVDADGVIRQRNAVFERLFAAPQDGCVLDLVAERDGLAQALRNAAAGRSNLKPVDAPLKGGRSGRFYVSAVEPGGCDGEAAIVFALDTTEQRALEEQVAQGRKMQAIGELAGGVAHDFNNMLTAILGHCDFLLADRKPGDPSFRDIMHIKQNANRAAGLVRQLLAFSRRQTLRPQVLALDDALADLSILLKGLLGAKINLNLVRGQGLWLVKADLNQFEQVIVNLAVNARDAMPDGGTLTLRTANVAAADVVSFSQPELPPADYVMIEVADTGSGIAPEIRDKIFEPFFSTKEVGKGTGLGLSSVYGTVRQTGGYVFVESLPGRGATFRIFLPRHSPGAEAAEPARKEAAPPVDLTGRGTILLVEDEHAVRALASRALASRGYTVLEAATGAEALSLMRTHDSGVDLVVSDVVMPEMDGPTLLKQLRKMRPDLKIVFVSGYARDAFARNLGSDESFSFLAKPFTLKELAQTVKETLN